MGTGKRAGLSADLLENSRGFDADEARAYGAYLQELFEDKPAVKDNVIWLIECRTGCSCCSSENHYRGPYRSEEDAQRRIAYFQSEASEYWPVASQYARRGRYTIERHEVEFISGDRFILEDEVHHGAIEFIEVLENGTVGDNEAEQFYR